MGLADATSHRYVNEDCDYPHSHVFTGLLFKGFPEMTQFVRWYGGAKAIAT
jgi:hypothetical protein